MATKRATSREERNRETAREADRLGRRILTSCNRLVGGHEIRVADPEDVPAGRPLVSLLLYRLTSENHAFDLRSAVDDLVGQLQQAARRRRGDKRAKLNAIADRIATLS